MTGGAADAALLASQRAYMNAPASGLTGLGATDEALLASQRSYLGLPAAGARSGGNPALSAVDEAAEATKALPWFKTTGGQAGIGAGIGVPIGMNLGEPSYG